jgi:starch synthase
MTIHNLAFQGNFPPENVARLGLPARSFDMHGVEFHGQLSFLKAGLYYAEHITTVSPNYAREIQSEPLGFGLQGLLSTRREQITGIINGIDENVWNPAIDPYIASHYTRADLQAKTVNKRALQKAMALTQDDTVPLFAAISRITHQKGFDVLQQIAPQLVEIPAQLAILGSGNAEMERNLTALARAYPGKIAVHIGYTEALSHLIEAGADCFLMPSRFEPCGLNQMYSQRYGTPPLVHATGGLVDTVVDCTPATLKDGSATGFVFHPMTAEQLLATIRRAAKLHQDTTTWRMLQQNGMAKDFSWRTSAAAYQRIYRMLAGKTD